MSTLTSRNAKKILDQQGKEKTLARGLSSFVYSSPENFSLANFQGQSSNNIQHEKVLILGLGYNAKEDLKDALKQAKEVYAFEYDVFEKACNEANIQIDKPENIHTLYEEELYSFLADKNNLGNLAIYIYRQNLMLFPSFWNKLFLNIEDILKNSKNTPLNDTVENGSNTDKNASKKALFASFTSDLMHFEVKEAIEENGFECLTYSPKDLGIENLNNSVLQMNEQVFPCLKQILQKEKPNFFLSINGRFLDANGRIYTLLEHLNIPLALWIVDNVWNIISAFKNDFWKECYLFVTDSSFIPKLKEYGAKHVYYLPLAGSKNINKFVEPKHYNISEIDLLYVGHSAFKGKDKFFSAVDKKNEYLTVIEQEIDKSFENNTINNAINFHTIYEEISKNKNINLWGNDFFREISYLAGEADIYNKIKWLQTLSTKIKLNIIGDDGWKQYLNNTKIIPPVDYYTTLPCYYKKAKFTLNIPSFLMPSALTQRHFDVCLAGGFLLSAPTKGLEIFTSYAQEIMLVKSPNDVLKKVENLFVDETSYNNMKKYMCEEIEASHLYKHRIATICNVMF